MASATMPPRGETQAAKAAGHPLDAVFAPKSVAVLGVTPTPDTVPYDIFHNILTSGYQGTVYPVAPGKRSICAVRAYRYVLDIEDPVDQAVIVFPANVVDRALEQCGRKGIRSAIVISAGFREVGPQGAERERRLKEICRGIRDRHDRAELPGGDQHRPAGAAERLLRPQDARRRADRLPQPVRRALHGGARLRPREADRLLEVRQFRQQGGRDRDRAVRLPAPGPADGRDPALSGGVAGRAGADRGRPPRHPRRQRQADPGDQVGPDAARGRRRGQPHRLAGRRGRRLRRRLPRGRHHPRRQHRGAVQRRHRSTPISRCRPATAWRSSPTRAGRG